MTRRVFLHTLSAPEYLWLGFLRTFFAQKTLMRDTGDQVPLPNRFFLDQSVDPANRAFDVVLSDDFYRGNTNALPLVVLEDTGCQQTGLVINNLGTWSASPITLKHRVDQIRHRYMIHCLSRDRGESRMLAALVTKAVTVFRDQLLFDGAVKVEPWQIAPTQDVRRGRGDGEESFIDTAVSVEFTMMEHWGTEEEGVGTAEGLTLRFVDDQKARFVRSSVRVQDPRLQAFIRSSTMVSWPTLQTFVRASSEISEPLTAECFVVAQATVQAPTFSEGFIRSSVRVAA